MYIDKEKKMVEKELVSEVSKMIYPQNMGLFSP